MKSHAIQFLSTGAILATWLFTPSFAEKHGADDFQIGILFLGYGVSIFASFLIFGRLSDNHGRKPFLVGGLFLAALCFTLQGLSFNIYLLFATRAMAGFTAGIFPSSLLAYVHEAQKKMGKFSSAGSLGWGFGVLLGGVVAEYADLRTVYFLAGGLFLVSGLLSLGLPNIHYQRQKVPLFPREVILRNKHIYTSFLIRHSGANAIWVIFPLYLEDLGADMLWIGIINAINAFGQAVFMYALGDRIPPQRLMSLGLLGSVVSFILFSLATNMWHIMPMQILLAFSWACLYVGSVRELVDENEERATALGVFSSVMSLSMIFGAIIGTAVIFFTESRRGTIVAAASISAIALAYWHIYGCRKYEKCIRV